METRTTSKSNSLKSLLRSILSQPLSHCDIFSQAALKLAPKRNFTSKLRLVGYTLAQHGFRPDARAWLDD